MAKFEVKRPSEEDEQPWLISYADMVTLLMCFFMLLLSMSTLNKAKVELVAQSFVQKNKMTYKELQQQIQNYINSEKLQDQINVSLTPNGIEVSFKDKLLYTIGSADLRPESADALTKIAGFLTISQDISKRKVSVHGHTDSIPIKSKVFPSNWELSSARAASVVNFFISKGLIKDRFESIGYADTRPMTQERADKHNGTPENRRVVVVISPDSYIDEINAPTIAIPTTPVQEKSSSVTQ